MPWSFFICVQILWMEKLFGRLLNRNLSFVPKMWCTLFYVGVCVCVVVCVCECVHAWVCRCECVRACVRASGFVFISCEKIFVEKRLFLVFRAPDSGHSPSKRWLVWTDYPLWENIKTILVEFGSGVQNTQIFARCNLFWPIELEVGSGSRGNLYCPGSMDCRRIGWEVFCPWCVPTSGEGVLSRTHRSLCAQGNGLRWCHHETQTFQSETKSSIFSLFSSLALFSSFFLLLSLSLSLSSPSPSVSSIRYASNTCRKLPEHCSKYFLNKGKDVNI